jgi:hypothetical protein
MKLKMDLKESFKKYEVNYSFDGKFTYTTIVTQSNVKIFLTNTNSQPFQLLVKIKNKSRMPLSIDKWIEMHGETARFEFITKFELKDRISTLLKWLKTVPSNTERKQLLIESLKTQIKANPILAMTVMLEMYDRQTHLEKQLRTSNVTNWIGFTKFDSKFMSEMSEQIIKRGRGSVRSHYTQICHQMQKYAGQYLQSRNVL